MRRYLTLPLAAGTLLPLALATPAGAAGNGVAGKNAPAIVAASLAAMRAAPSFSLDGSIVTVGETIGIHLTVSTDHGSKGTLTINGDAVHLLQIGQVVYFSAGKPFWKKQGGSAIAQLFAGRWVDAPVTNSSFSSFSDFLDPQRLTSQLLPDPHSTDLHKGRTSVVAGRRVVAVSGTSSSDGSKSTIYVATSGKPYVVRLSSDGSGSGSGTGSGKGSVTFTGYGKPVHVLAPKNPISYTALTGGS